MLPAQIRASVLECASPLALFRMAINSTSNPSRSLALDALRGLAILAMLLSGQMPFDGHALPSWMYHAQEPPPTFQWNGNLPGISWVDLVFPFFLFAMGAAFPLALSRRLERAAMLPADRTSLIGSAGWKHGSTLLFVAERGFLLGFFALFVQLIRPYTMNQHPTTQTWLLALLGFFIFFPILARLPEAWPRAVKISTRAAGWLAAILFCAFTVYPDGSGFSLGRSDIIIIVLTNTAVFGSLVWMFTRENLLLRLGVLGIIFAIRLSNLPTPTDGWVREVWAATEHCAWTSWIFHLYYLQYLCIVIPGTIAGDLILQWTRRETSPEKISAAKNWPLAQYAAILLTMISILLVTLIGLKARWLIETTLPVFALCFTGWMLLQNPLNETEKLFKQLFHWGIYWLVLGLIFEPWEGGIKKDHPTLSYYFVTSGLAICVFIGFSILIDVWQQKRWLRLLIDNGQNPMIAYAGINNFITPVLALVGADKLLTQFATTPWRGFWKGAIITLLMALTVSFLTRKKIFWRT
jgi:predicted acyltransferase